MLQMEFMKSTRNEGTGGLPCSFFIIRRCRLMRVTASIDSCLQGEICYCLPTTIKGKRGSVRKRAALRAIPLSIAAAGGNSRILIRQQSDRPDDEGAQHSKHRALGKIVARHVIRELGDPRDCEERAQRNEDLERVEEDNRPKNEDREIVCVPRTDLRAAKTLEIVDRDVLHVVIVASGCDSDRRCEREARRQEMEITLDQIFSDETHP